MIMQIRRITLLAVAGSQLSFSVVQDGRRDTSAAAVERRDTLPIPDTLRRIQNLAFSGGEYLRFDVHFGFVTAGEAVMKVTDTIHQSGRPVHRIDFTLESKPFFDFFFKVRDKYVTLIDREGMFPWRFEQHIREGSFARDFTAEFDQYQHVAITSGGRYRTPPYVQDMMSAFYFARTIDFRGFRPGQKVHLQNFYKDSTYNLDVKYKGIQVIETGAGKFRCIIIEPLAQEGGLFKSEGKILIWMTDDDRRIPVKVSTEIKIGSVESELAEYRGINGPIGAKIEDD